MASLYFEDLHPGRRFRVGSYRLRKEEMIEVARRWEPQPHHVDEAAAAASPFRGLTACSLHLFAVCTRLFFDWDEQIAVVAMLGKEAVRFPRPARAGDLLRYDTECIDRRASRSRPHHGIITLADVLANQDGEEVLTQKVKILVARRQQV